MATYYVHFTNGDEGNAGTQVAPLKYHPWMLGSTSGVTLAAGDTVYMAKGESWTVDNPASHFVTVGASGSAVGGYITTTAYGTGDLPVIKINTDTNKSVIYAEDKDYIALDSINIKHNSSTYSADAFKCGILATYSSTGCGYWKITNSEIEDCPYACVMGSRASWNWIVGNDSASSTATDSAYSNHIHHYGLYGVRLQGVKADTELSNHKVFYNYVHDSTRANVGDNAYGIIFDTRSDSVAWPQECYVYYNYVANIPTWEGIDHHGGKGMYYRYNKIYNVGIPFSLGANDKSGDGVPNLFEDWYVEYNIIENPHDKAYSGKGDIVINGVAATAATNVNIKNNTIFYTSKLDAGKVSYGIYFWYVDGIYIYDNHCYNSNGDTLGNTYWIYGTGTGVSKNWHIKRNKLYGAANPITINTLTATGDDCYIESNVIDSLRWGVEFGSTASTLTYNIYILNNTIVANKLTEYCGALYDNAYTMDDGYNIYFYNNIYKYNGETTLGRYISLAGSNWVADCNIYHGSTSAAPMRIGNSAISWDTYDNTYEPNSPDPVDPQLVNISTLDFRLNTGSPAIKTGSATAGQFADLDVQGNGRRTAAPCIGAYEYVKWMGVISPAKINGKNYRVGAGSVK